MIVQTIFEPLNVRSALGYSVVKTKDLQSLLKRLQNAEMGFSYVHTHILPGLKQSRDQHMLNAQRVRDRAAQGMAPEGRGREGGHGSSKLPSPVGNADAPKGEGEA